MQLYVNRFIAEGATGGNEWHYCILEPKIPPPQVAPLTEEEKEAAKGGRGWQKSCHGETGEKRRGKMIREGIGATTSLDEPSAANASFVWTKWRPLLTSGNLEW